MVVVPYVLCDCVKVIACKVCGDAFEDSTGNLHINGWRLILFYLTHLAFGLPAFPLIHEHE